MSESDYAPQSSLTREAILGALTELSDELGAIGVSGEICLFGGTVMLLAFGARPATKDVDAIFQPTELVRQLARRVADSRRLPPDWLNDGVKGFTSTKGHTTTGNMPQFSHLRVTMPVPEYLLAMKCMAARIGATAGEPSDVVDIRFLIEHLQLRTSASVLAIVADYYPARLIPVRTQYLIEGLFDEDPK